MAKQSDRKGEDDKTTQKKRSSEEEKAEESDAPSEDERDEDDGEEEEEDESDESQGEEEEEEEESEEDEASEEEETSDEQEEEEEEDEAPPKAASDDEAEPSSKSALAEGEGGDDDEVLPAQLGAQRYVYTAFFAATILFGYILGRALETAWERIAVSDWAADKLPFLSSVTDDSKQTYSFIVAGVIAIVTGLRQFRKESIRKWSEEVSSELLKVKWPNRKEVYSATVVVLATSGVAIAYLFLADRFFSFVTNLIYGTGT